MGVVFFSRFGHKLGIDFGNFGHFGHNYGMVFALQS